MTSFQAINQTNIGLLEIFLTELGHEDKSFRYFDKRSIDVVLNHLTAILILNEHKKPIAYGHLEKEGGVLWLGIAVIKESRGQGVGEKMMIHLIDYAKVSGENQITLTVDKDNYKAIRLYERLGFELEKVDTYFYRYVLQIS